MHFSTRGRVVRDGRVHLGEQEARLRAAGRGLNKPPTARLEDHRRHGKSMYIFRQIVKVCCSIFYKNSANFRRFLQRIAILTSLLSKLLKFREIAGEIR